MSHPSGPQPADCDPSARGLRLALITRRYWPLLGGAERVMSDLATEFTQRGCAVTVLTARWQPDWPAQLQQEKVRVVRLPQPAVRWWGTWRYMRAVEHWLRRHRQTFDLVYVSMFKHDAYAALTPDRTWPVVIRAEGAGATGDMHWQLEAPWGRRIKRRCFRAEAFFAPSRAIQTELIAAGYARPRIAYVPNGVRVGRIATAAERNAARQGLAAAHLPLKLPADALLALYTGRLHPGKGLSHLVDAFALVAGRLPTAYLWIAGDGPLRRALLDQIAERHLTGRVVLTGQFDGVEELLTAADAYVLPSAEEGMSVAVLEAMAAGLPVVVSDIPGNRALVQHEVQGLIAPVGDATSWAAAIERVLTGGDAALALGRAAHQRVADEFSLARTVDEHLQRFEAVVKTFRAGLPT